MFKVLSLIFLILFQPSYAKVTLNVGHGLEVGYGTHISENYNNSDYEVSKKLNQNSLLNFGIGFEHKMQNDLFFGVGIDYKGSLIHNSYNLFRNKNGFFYHVIFGFEWKEFFGTYIKTGYANKLLISNTKNYKNIEYIGFGISTGVHFKIDEITAFYLEYFTSTYREQDRILYGTNNNTEEMKYKNESLIFGVKVYI